MQLKSFQILKERMAAQLGNTVTDAEIAKVLRTMAEIIRDKASENEPVRVKRLGVFGVYSYVVKENPLRFDKDNARRGKNAFKSGQSFVKGATHYKTIFKPSQFLRGVLN